MATNSLRADTATVGPCQKQADSEPARTPAQASPQARYPRHTHDAWALPIEVLQNALGAETFEKELHDDEKALLIAHRDRLLVVTVPGLPDKSREHLVRLLLTEYIRHGWAAITLDSQQNARFGESLEDEARPIEAYKGDPPDARVKRITDVRNLYDGSVYAPLHGWRSDEEAIAALRELITDALDGVAEDIPEGAYPLPDAIGAAVTIGYDEHGKPHPLVWVRADLPSGLRADLWGYCTALAVGFHHVDVEPDENGIYYVGTERSPVIGPGTALLAAVTLQRLGRRPEDCAFPLFSSPDQAEMAPPLAA
ncbi:hypothetical protein QF035_002350 [Streptomyces umbrinus]|uniref:Uncharacterized protein n=1 Tax=Streptomyces umbrinus TaxID=67370 RepID=A0ABU0SMH8_9ACTN|nr:hypothetical protein [Streptomyces umbrinus]MDQ1024768.1 hypothetical protein [Streptomyces umbrinus]